MVEEAGERDGEDVVVVELRAIRARLAVLVAEAGRAADAGPVDDAVRVDRLAALEQLRNTAYGVQVAETVRFAASQVAAQRRADVDYRQLGRGIADQVGMATKTGPWHGSRRVGLARSLWIDLPATYALLVAGEINDQVAQRVATETSHLDPETRRRVDTQIVAAGLEAMTVREAERCARTEAYRADPQASVDRACRARADRRVGLRPAPDTMTWLSALLPVEQGVACRAALERAADTARSQGDDRTRGQVMADTLVERVTGQAAAGDVAIEVNVLVPVDALLDPDSPAPAQVAGHGPLPRGVFGQLLTDNASRTRWRRLFTAPLGGATTIIGCDPRARLFTGILAHLLRLRDQRCREPFCDAPIRHSDHLTHPQHGGPTTLANGRGVCERHNYTRELPGWQVTPTAPDHPSAPHTVTTPTGHTYRSRAPDPP